MPITVLESRRSAGAAALIEGAAFRLAVPSAAVGTGRAISPGAVVMALVGMVLIVALVAGSVAFQRTASGKFVMDSGPVGSASELVGAGAGDGGLLVTTVSFRAATVGEVVRSWFDPSVRFLGPDEIPPEPSATGDDGGYVDSVRYARAAAARCLGLRPDPDAPVPASAEMHGPSGGLMMALAHLRTLGHDVPGAGVAGTGVIAPDGRVHPIKGIGWKLKGAESAGATVFLAPAEQGAEATAAAASIKVVPVATLDEALHALGGPGCTAPPR